jgi:hypothetical protein
MAKRGDGKSSRPNQRGSSDYDALAAVLNNAIESRGGPKIRMGTVKKNSDNTVDVKFDDNDTEPGRKSGHAGGKKRAGDKVVMFDVGDGNWVAVGPVLEDGRKDREQIGADEIERDAIQERHIKQGTIKRTHFDQRTQRIIGGNDLEERSITNSHLTNALSRDIARMGHVNEANKRLDGHKSRQDRFADRMKKVDGKDE